jgi:hypothetical protein
MAQPADTAHAVSPESVLDADRWGVVIQGSLGGFLYGTAFALAASSPAWLVLASGAVFALVGVVALALGSAWGGLVIARVWLAARGQLPWRLMTFLVDAHHKGVLRQTGAVHQFRHACLQRNLDRRREVTGGPAREERTGESSRREPVPRGAAGKLVR